MISIFNFIFEVFYFHPGITNFDVNRFVKKKKKLVEMV